jgi:hypothetical protein
VKAPVKERTGLTSTGSGLGLGKLAKSAHNLKEAEEAQMRGEEVELLLKLSDGRTEKAKVRIAYLSIFAISLLMFIASDGVNASGWRDKYCDQ